MLRLGAIGHLATSSLLHRALRNCRARKCQIWVADASQLCVYRMVAAAANAPAGWQVGRVPHRRRKRLLRAAPSAACFWTGFNDRASLDRCASPGRISPSTPPSLLCSRAMDGWPLIERRRRHAACAARSALPRRRSGARAHGAPAYSGTGATPRCAIRRPLIRDHDPSQRASNTAVVTRSRKRERQRTRSSLLLTTSGSDTHSCAACERRL